MLQKTWLESTVSLPFEFEYTGMIGGNRKYKREFRGKFGSTTKGSSIAFGEYALKAVGTGELRENQLKAATECLRRVIKDKGKLYCRLDANIPVTAKPVKVKMGGGKGRFDHYSAFVRSGKIIMEVSGISQTIARRALYIAASKLPIKTAIVTSLWDESNTR